MPVLIKLIGAYFCSSTGPSNFLVGSKSDIAVNKDIDNHFNAIKRDSS